jgi:ribose transport system substrate-binding protein
MIGKHPPACVWLIGLTIAILAITISACGGGGSSNSGASEGVAEPSESNSQASETPTSEESEESGGASASSVGQLEVGKLNFDFTKYCGEKPMKIGLIDGFGGNTWRVQVHAMEEKLANECPNMEEFKYFDANLEPEKYNSTIAAWASQGINVIQAYPDFGQLSVPAFKAATAQGVFIGTDNSIPGNATVPADIAAGIIPNFEKGSKEWIEFLDRANKGTAKVVFIGGPAGNLFDAPAMEEMKQAIETTGADVEFLEGEPVAGNWEPAKTQQAATQLIAKYPEINGVVLSYMATMPSVVRAFEAAGEPLPTIVGDTSSNEVVCETAKLREKDPNFNLFSLDASGNAGPLALVKAIAAYQEIEAPELGTTTGLTESNFAPYIDTLNGEIPKCVPDIPAGADLSMAQTQKEVEEVTQ